MRSAENLRPEKNPACSVIFAVVSWPMLYSRRIITFFLVSSILSSVLYARDEVEIPSDDLPQRIVQVGSSAFIIENALYMFPEASERIVAMAEGDQGSGFFAADLDPDIKNKTILPRNTNTEAVLALDPDTVVMKKYLKDRMGEPLERVGIPAVYLDLETPEAWAEDLETIGFMFGNPDRAVELQKLFNQRIEFVESPLAALKESEKPRTLLLYWSVKDGTSSVNIPPISWIQTRIVDMAGGVPVWKDAELDERWTRTGIEQIAVWDPDVIIIAAYHINASDALSQIKKDPSWSNLRAVANNNIHAFPADYYSWDQPDARWLLGLQWLAHSLHPEKYPGLDMENEARQFFRDFFFMGESEFDEFILPRLTGLD